MAEVIINGVARSGATVQVRWFRSERDESGDAVCFWAIETSPPMRVEEAGREKLVEITIDGRHTTGGWGKRDGTLYGIGRFPFSKAEWEAIVRTPERKKPAEHAQ